MSHGVEQRDRGERLADVVVGAGGEAPRRGPRAATRAVTITIIAPAVAGSARSARHRSSPLSPGIIQSSRTTSGGAARAVASARVAVRGLVDVETADVDREPHQGAQALVVLGDEYAGTAVPQLTRLHAGRDRSRLPRVGNTTAIRSCQRANFSAL